MRFKRNQSFVALSVMLSTLPFPAGAESALDALKAIAQGAKVLQEKMGQSDGAVKSEQSAGNDQGVFNTGDASGAVDESTLRQARKKMDIVGLRVGMSLDEAMRGLKRHNPRLMVKERLVQTFADADNKPHTWRIFLIESDRATTVETFSLFVSLPPNSRVVSIARNRKYTKENAPTMASALDALLKKYGKESLVRHEETNSSGYAIKNFFWQVGGRVEKNRLCGAAQGPEGWSFEGHPRSYKDNTRCGLAFAATVMSHQDNSALVYDVSAKVTDYNMIYQDWQSSYDYLRNASRVRDKSEIEAAKKRSAPSF